MKRASGVFVPGNAQARRIAPASFGFFGFGLATGLENLLAARTQQWSHTADSDAAVCGARPVGLFLQVLLAIALDQKIFRRDVVPFGQDSGDRFRAAVRQCQIVFRSADSIGVAFDQKDFTRVLVDKLAKHPYNAL